jgi:hypothetical protein
MTPNFEELIEQLVNSGQMSPELLGQVQAAMNDPAKLDEVLAALTAMGADQVGSGPALNIEDFYRDGPVTYEARWPIAASLPIQFSQLDRKTKFFVLFQEWTRREMEGMMALNGGNLEEARATFSECLERARQIDVEELMARSYEGMGKVADRLGDRAAGRECSQKAAQARTA